MPLWRVVRAPERGQGTLPAQEVTFLPDSEKEGSVGELVGGGGWEGRAGGAGARSPAYSPSLDFILGAMRSYWKILSE